MSKISQKNIFLKLDRRTRFSDVLVVYFTGNYPDAMLKFTFFPDVQLHFSPVLNLKSCYKFTKKKTEGMHLCISSQSDKVLFCVNRLGYEYQ
jgi:hypothetical protein